MQFHWMGGGGHDDVYCDALYANREGQVLWIGERNFQVLAAVEVLRPILLQAIISLRQQLNNPQQQLCPPTSVTTITIIHKKHQFIFIIITMFDIQKLPQLQLLIPTSTQKDRNETIFLHQGLLES